MSGAEPLLRATGISRRYRRGPETVTAFHGVDLALQPGEVVALVGPSGSGKTTLLNVLCGWERPDEGRVEWRGMADFTLATLSWSEISIVPQSAGLLEDLTLIENVSLARRLGAKQHRGERAAHLGHDRHEAEEILGRLGLAHLSEHIPRATSLGEQQRTAVARALLPRSSLVLADEPTAHQDSVIH